MRIVIDSYIYQNQLFGGISRLFDNLLPKLCDINDEIKIEMILDYLPQKILPFHPQISTLDMWNKYRFNPFWRLSKRLHSRYFNYVLEKEINNYEGAIWFPTYYTMPSFPWKGTKFIFVYDLIYEMYPDLLPNSDKVINDKRKSIQKADAIICISNTTAKDLQKYYDIHHSKVFVVHLGFDDQFTIRSNDSITHRIDFPYFIYIGQRGYYKGFDTVINSFSNWSGNNKIKLIVVGPPLTLEEEQLLVSKKLTEKVLIFPNINDSQLCDFYNQAKALIYPSLYEGFGIPLLESMACGCPIIASKIPSTIEVAKNIPIYFEPGNEEDLIVAMNKAINEINTIKRNQDGLTLSKEYSWNKMADQIYKIIRSIQILKT